MSAVGSPPGDAGREPLLMLKKAALDFFRSGDGPAFEETCCDVLAGARPRGEPSLEPAGTFRERYDLARQEFYSVKHRTDDIPTALTAAFDVLVRPALRPTPDASPRGVHFVVTPAAHGSLRRILEIAADRVEVEDLERVQSAFGFDQGLNLLDGGTPDAGPGRDRPREGMTVAAARRALDMAADQLSGAGLWTEYEVARDCFRDAVIRYAGELDGGGATKWVQTWRTTVQAIEGHAYEAGLAAGRASRGPDTERLDVAQELLLRPLVGDRLVHLMLPDGIEPSSDLRALLDAAIAQRDGEG